VSGRALGPAPAWLWLAPAGIPLLLIGLVPVALLCYISVTSFEIGYAWSDREFIGLANYDRLFSGREVEFWPALRLSVIVALISVALKTLLGLGIALLLNRRLKFEHLIVALLILPMAVNPAIAGLMWKLLFSFDFGLVNVVLEQLGGQKIVWLGQSYALFAVLVVLVWMHFPLSALMLLAGLRNIPAETIESARVEGSSSWQVFWWIVLPQLKPVLIASSLFQAILAFQVFGPIFAMTDGGPGHATEILPIYIYKTAFGIGAMGLSAAAAVVLVVITMALAVAMMASGRTRR
jgi:multiple sugar transport system permease protein